MQVEDFKYSGEDQDTATSNFFHRPSIINQSYKSAQDQTPIEHLEGQSARILETISVVKQLQKRIEENKELDGYVLQSKEELGIIQTKNQISLKYAKDTFEQSLSILDKQLNSIKKQWKQIKQTKEAQIVQDVLKFKESAKVNQSLLAKSIKKTTEDFKKRAQQVSMELKQTKQQRVEQRSKLMSQIQYVRSRLEERVDNERRKRKEYDEIILGLLDNTVDQGERLLRRIL